MRSVSLCEGVCGGDLVCLLLQREGLKTVYISTCLRMTVFPGRT